MFKEKTTNEIEKAIAKALQEISGYKIYITIKTIKYDDDNLNIDIDFMGTTRLEKL